MKVSSVGGGIDLLLTGAWPTGIDRLVNNINNQY